VQTSVERAIVLVVHPDPDQLQRLSETLERADFEVVTAARGREAIEAICARPPMCAVIKEDFFNPLNASIVADLKADNVYGHVPILAVLEESELNGADWTRLPVDDYLVAPLSESELLSRVRLSIARIQRDIHANPLTGLPGNPSIMLQAERRIRTGLPFALAHADLDSFKPFNDHYGFARGDEVIRMTARLIANTIKSLDSPDTHVGHIGGDDFVFMVPPELADTACTRFLQDFDQIVMNFYDPEDIEQGGINSVNRQGVAQTFPIMTCSIGVVDTGQIPVQHIGELCSRLAEVKSFAKKLPGSSYLIDRRKR
jgi:diguanylate cyclase (GGDEF)-like protein